MKRLKTETVENILIVLAIGTLSAILWWAK